MGPMLKTHRTGIGPGQGRGWGLGSMWSEGPRSALALEGEGPGPGPQQAPWSQVGGGNSRCVPPILDPLIPEGPCPLASLLHAPRTHMARGGPGRQGARTVSLTGFPGLSG